MEGSQTPLSYINVIICIIFVYIVDYVSAQTSCVIIPSFTKLFIRGGVIRDVEFHCRCMDGNGIINGTRWFHNGNLIPTRNNRGNTTAPYYINNNPVVLFIERPFTSSDTGTYTCSPNSTFPTIYHLERRLLFMERVSILYAKQKQLVTVKRGTVASQAN